MVDLSLFPPTTTIDGADLKVGGCSLTAISRDFGTPVFVIDETALRSRAREYIQEFKRQHSRSRICFAVKSFPSASIIRILAEEGVGFDVVGVGELRIALAAGADPAAIVMHGNAKQTMTSGRLSMPILVLLLSTVSTTSIESNSSRLSAFLCYFEYPPPSR